MNQLETRFQKEAAFYPGNDFFRASLTTFESGAKMLTSMDPDATKELITSFEKTGKGRLNKGFDNRIEVLDSMWQDYNDTHTDLHVFNDLIRIKERIIALNKHKKKWDIPFVILDWGCGSGHTLNQLSKWLDEQKIFDVKLYGFANQIHPDWKYAAENITFILDVADHLPLYFKDEKIDLIYSIAGLYYLFLPDSNNQKYDMVEYFKRHQFNSDLFKIHSHTEKYLEHLSFILKPHGELLIDLPIHIIDVNYDLLQTQNKHFIGLEDHEKYGEYAFVVVPTDSSHAC
ncbi:MAG: class I SAM-dependent methyltransferase [Pseudomonadota bacterium]